LALNAESAKGDFFIWMPRPGAIAPPKYSPRPVTLEGQQMFHVKQHVRQIFAFHVGEAGGLPL
jgi:hypothetical protein